MDDNVDYWMRYGIFEEEDIQSARKIGKRSYDGNAKVLPSDDPLIVEWENWERLYG